MTPRERFLACLRGEEVDRVPLDLEGLFYSSREALEAEQDSLKRDVASRVFDEMHFFHQLPGFVNRYLVTPGKHIREVSFQEKDGEVLRTTEIETPKGKLTAQTGRNAISNTGWTLKYPVESLEDIEKIRSIKWERPERLAPPDLTNLPADFDHRGVVRGGVSSPMVCVAGMMKYEYFLELCASEIELIEELTAICLERILDVLEVQLSERSIEYMWMGGSEWITPPMGSPRLYERLVQKYETPIIERIHEAGGLSHVHCHGNVKSTIKSVIARGADFFEPVEPPPDGDITMAEAKAIAAGRMTLGGNVEARVLEKGTVDEVEQATRAAFEGGTDRMVLRNTAGPISAFDKCMHRNYHRMIDVWEECSAIETPAECAAAVAG